MSQQQAPATTHGVVRGVINSNATDAESRLTSLEGFIDAGNVVLNNTKAFKIKTLGGYDNNIATITAGNALIIGDSNVSGSSVILFDVAGKTSLVKFANNEIVLNDGGSNVDSKIKSSGDANCFTVDGGNDAVAVGKLASTKYAKLEVLDGSGDSILRLTRTENTNFADFGIDTSSHLTITPNGSGKVFIADTELVLDNTYGLQIKDFGGSARNVIQVTSSDNITIGTGTGDLDEIIFRTNEGFGKEASFSPSGYEFNIQNRATHDFIINGTDNDQVVFNSGTQGFAVGKDPSVLRAKFEILSNSKQFRVTETENTNFLDVTVNFGGNTQLDPSGGTIGINGMDANSKLYIKQDSDSVNDGIKISNVAESSACVIYMSGGSFRIFRSNEKVSMTGNDVIWNNDGNDVNHRWEGDTLPFMMYLNGDASLENIAFLTGSEPDWQTMDGGIFIGDASTAPIDDPANGFFFYGLSGNPTFRTSGGDIISLLASAAYTPTNVTPDRSYDADATTLDEIADVLGTLITDLQATGLVA